MIFRSLSEFAEVKGGKRLPKGQNLISTPNTHPYIRVRDLGAEKVLELTPDYEYVDDETQKLISRYIVNQDDLIISIVGTIGLVAKIGKSLDGSNLTENCAKFVNIQGLNRDFLYYYLASEAGQNAIKAATVGAVQAKLPLKNIQALPVPDLPLAEQKAIAETLSALDARIAENKAINNHLASTSATDSSPDNRRGKSVSRSSVRRLDSSTRRSRFLNMGATTAIKSFNVTSVGIAI